MSENEQTDKPEECECCHFETGELEYYRGGYGESSQWLCEICSSTFLSSIVRYPQNYKVDAALAKSIGWIGNRLLQEIREGRSTPPTEG